MALAAHRTIILGIVGRYLVRVKAATASSYFAVNLDISAAATRGSVCLGELELVDSHDVILTSGLGGRMPCREDSALCWIV